MGSKTARTTLSLSSQLRKARRPHLSLAKLRLRPSGSLPPGGRRDLIASPRCGIRRQRQGKSLTQNDAGILSPAHSLKHDSDWLGQLSCQGSLAENFVSTLWFPADTLQNSDIKSSPLKTGSLAGLGFECVGRYGGVRSRRPL